jgi:hypothetical protein
MFGGWAAAGAAGSQHPLVGDGRRPSIINRKVEARDSPRRPSLGVAAGGGRGRRPSLGGAAGGGRVKVGDASAGWDGSFRHRWRQSGSYKGSQPRFEAIEPSFNTKMNNIIRGGDGHITKPGMISPRTSLFDAVGNQSPAMMLKILQGNKLAGTASPMAGAGTKPDDAAASDPIPKSVLIAHQFIAVASAAMDVVDRGGGGGPRKGPAKAKALSRFQAAAHMVADHHGGNIGGRKMGGRGVEPSKQERFHAAAVIAKDANRLMTKSVKGQTKAYYGAVMDVLGIQHDEDDDDADGDDPGRGTRFGDGRASSKEMDGGLTLASDLMSGLGREALVDMNDDDDDDDDDGDDDAGSSFHFGSIQAKAYQAYLEQAQRTHEAEEESKRRKAIMKSRYNNDVVVEEGGGEEEEEERAGRGGGQQREGGEIEEERQEGGGEEDDVLEEDEEGGLWEGERWEEMRGRILAIPDYKEQGKGKGRRPRGNLKVPAPVLRVHLGPRRKLPTRPMSPKFDSSSRVGLRGSQGASSTSTGAQADRVEWRAKFGEENHEAVGQGAKRRNEVTCEECGARVKSFWVKCQECSHSLRQMGGKWRVPDSSHEGGGTHGYLIRNYFREKGTVGGNLMSFGEFQNQVNKYRKRLVPSPTNAKQPRLEISMLCTL